MLAGAGLLCSGPAFGAKPRTAPRPPAAPACSGVYADAQFAMAATVRDFENGGGAKYTRLIRTETTYETLYYGLDGKVQKRRVKNVVFGTGVAYARHGDDVYFLSNTHVTVLPAVTSEQYRVEGIPSGAKKVLEENRLVESDTDENWATQVKLSRVVSDPMADATILKVKSTGPNAIPVMPYRIGRSSDLKVGNFVYVRGFPLGVFQAVNVGRVTNPLDEDREQGWFHRDFIIDALLSSGNSGSPVFAVSCKTGQLELVGIYHAAYRQASALNAVVAVDDLRELIETLKPPKRVSKISEQPLTLKDRARLIEELRRQGGSTVFPFAGAVASAELSGEHDLFLSVYDRDYPLSLDRRLRLVEQADETFGTVVSVDFRDAGAVKHNLAEADFDAGILGAVEKLYQNLMRQLIATIDYRHSKAASQPTTADKPHDLQKQRNTQRDLLEATLSQLEDEMLQRSDSHESVATPNAPSDTPVATD